MPNLDRFRHHFANSLKGRAVLYRIAGLLRWLIWGVKYAVIGPLVTIAVVVILLFRMDGTTPGQLMAQEIGRVRAMAPSGAFPVRDCPDPVFTASSPVPENQPSLTENCPLKIAGAEEYAAEIDQSLLQTGQLIWWMLALLYTAVAFMTGNRPVKTLSYRRRALLYRQPDGSFRDCSGRPVSPLGMGEYLVVPGVTRPDEQLKTIYSAESVSTLIENTNGHILYAGESDPEKEGKEKHE